MTEIEAKLRVNDLDKVRRQLESAGGQFVGRYMEDNHIFDTVEKTIQSIGCGLRVRSIKTLAGKSIPATLTYKGAAESSVFKRREEFETSVDDAEATCHILAKLGFIEIVSYRKTRERWTLDGCHVELDDVPLLGTFVEIEGHGEDAISAVRDKLELSHVEHEPQSYVRMLVAQCDRLNRTSIGIGFE